MTLPLRSSSRKTPASSPTATSPFGRIVGDERTGAVVGSDQARVPSPANALIRPAAPFWEPT